MPELTIEFEGTGRRMRVEDCPTDETYCFLIVEEAVDA
jgi:hypothetical protein